MWHRHSRSSLRSATVSGLGAQNTTSEIGIWLRHQPLPTPRGSALGVAPTRLILTWATNLDVWGPNGLIWVYPSKIPIDDWTPAYRIITRYRRSGWFDSLRFPGASLAQISVLLLSRSSTLQPPRSNQLKSVDPKVRGSSILDSTTFAWTHVTRLTNVEFCSNFGWSLFFNLYILWHQYMHQEINGCEVWARFLARFSPRSPHR